MTSRNLRGAVLIRGSVLECGTLVPLCSETRELTRIYRVRSNASVAQAVVDICWA
jgi:hypothetical protein